MDTKTILVTGIGGNVGQGILRNIRSLQLPIRIIGCDISSFTAGNHLCDQTYEIPYSYTEEYIPVIESIVAKEKIDLILPSTDYEVYYLAKNRHKVSAIIVSCDEKIAQSFLDKYATFQLFETLKLPFAKSWLPKDYDFSENDIIAKPREGRGSRGLLINPSDITTLSDEYMIQKLHQGIEITTAVYITKKGKLHGLFSMERKLENGATSQTIVNDTYDSTFKIIAEKIAEMPGVRGSLNIQSIVDKEGNVFPFEINCRISGTNSIRHNLGFQDIKYAIQEYLYNETPDQIQPKKGIATRILMDVIYTDATDFSTLNNASSNPIVY